MIERHLLRETESFVRQLGLPATVAVGATWKALAATPQSAPELSDEFVKNPADVVKVGQRVLATATEIDLPRKRIALSLKSKPELGAARQGERGHPGSPAKLPGRADNAFGKVDWFTAAQVRRP